MFGGLAPVPISQLPPFMPPIQAPNQIVGGQGKTNIFPPPPPPPNLVSNTGMNVYNIVNK